MKNVTGSATTSRSAKPASMPGFGSATSAQLPGRLTAPAKDYPTEALSPAAEIGADIVGCEKKIDRLEKTWHLYNSHFEQQNARSEMDSLSVYVAEQRVALAEAERAEQQAAETVDQLAAAAAASGDPAGIAVAHVIAGAMRTDQSATSLARVGVYGTEPLPPAAAAVLDRLNDQLFNTNKAVA